MIGVMYSEFVSNVMMKIVLLITLSVLICNSGFSQKVAVKSNLLYDATTSMKLGLEFGIAQKWTVDMSGNYNPWTFSDNKKMKHWFIQPEARWWTCEKFNGHFWGVLLHGGDYNWFGMLPF